MKRFLKDGKWIGLMLVACGLLFAACQGPSGGSSQEGAVTGDNSAVIPVTFNGPGASELTIGDGSGSAVAVINGHTVEVKNGDTGCAAGSGGNVATCWIKVINRAKSVYMANVFVGTTRCATCTPAAQFNNADVWRGDTLHIVGMDGNGGGAGRINGGEYAIVEDGIYSYGSPFNAMGAPVHIDPQAAYQPFQILHPDCGQRSIRWDFGGQTAAYGFYVSLRSQYFQWNPLGADLTMGTGDDDSRYNWSDRTTYYVMVTDLADKLAMARKTWYRIGSYVRSNVLSGYGAIGTGKAVFAPGRYFAVNVAVEYANRIEDYTMASLSNPNYEYYTQFAYVLKYDPLTVQRVTKTGKTSSTGTAMTTGALQICSACTKGKDTFRGYADPGGNQTAYGWGYLLTYEPIDGVLFNFFNPGDLYSTLNGRNNVVGSAATSQIPAFMANFGVANIKKSGGLTLNYNSTAVVQQGADAAPDMPMAMYFFRARKTLGVYGKVGKGSEFWTTMFASYNFPIFAYTNGTLTPSGKAVGTDDWFSHCYPFQAGKMNNSEQGCDLGLPQSSYFIFSGKEISNALIRHSGQAIPGGGAYQQWSAYICVN